MIVGITGGEQLVADVVGDPRTQRLVAVTGPAGCGKSALLDAVAGAYSDAGMTVTGADALDGERSPADGVVLVDDVHEQPREVVERLSALVGSPGVRLFVALRPLPQRADTLALLSAIRQRGHELHLEHLDQTGVERRATARLGVRPSPASLDVLYAETGGTVALVDDVLGCWQELQLAEGADGLVVPPAVVDRAQRVIGRVHPAARAVLQAIAVGCELDWDILSAVSGVPIDDVASAVAVVQSAGLLLPDGGIAPITARAALKIAGDRSTKILQLRLLRARHERQRDTVPVARSLARSGWQDGFLASLLITAAERVRASDPSKALELYAHAVQAGAPPEPLAVRRGECAARCGRYALAQQFVDPVLADPAGTHFAEALEISAVSLIHQGQLDRAGELYSWVGRDRIGGGVPTAVVALLATGRRAQASELLAGEQPTATLTGAIRSLVARGVHASVEGDAGAAVTTLVRATEMLESAARSTLLADSPAALVAVLALHAGNLDVAESALVRAIEHDIGGSAPWTRHRLLLGWVAMLRGQYGRARQLLDEIDGRESDGERPLRDELYLRALQLGLARRASDMATLVGHWRPARDVLLRHPVDLFMLLPLGELALAAARVREFEHVAAPLNRAWTLLRDLGEPVTWSPALHWYAVQAAIVRDRPDEVEPHAVALVRAAQTSPLAQALADAGRAWIQVLGGEFDPEFVEAAARRLQQFGLAWDGSRLLGQAAAHSSDRHTIAGLLQAARSMQQTDEPASAESSPTRGPVERAGHPAPERLSPRELDIALLLLQQRTYREIGHQLFISPKTVEHHVARMKQRLGVSGRADLLARLRALSASR